jgi:hypothetical protein
MARRSLWTRAKALEKRLPKADPDRVFVITRTIVDSGGSTVIASETAAAFEFAMMEAMAAAKRDRRVRRLLLDPKNCRVEQLSVDAF